MTKHRNLFFSVECHNNISMPKNGYLWNLHLILNQNLKTLWVIICKDNTNFFFWALYAILNLSYLKKKDHHNLCSSTVLILYVSLSIPSTSTSTQGTDTNTRLLAKWQKPTHRQRLLVPNPTPSPNPKPNPGNLCRTDKSCHLELAFTCHFSPKPPS